MFQTNKTLAASDVKIIKNVEVLINPTVNEALSVFKQDNSIRVLDSKDLYVWNAASELLHSGVIIEEHLTSASKRVILEKISGKLKETWLEISPKSVYLYNNISCSLEVNEGEHTYNDLSDKFKQVFKLKPYKQTTASSSEHDWWNKLSDSERRNYLSDHPESKLKLIKDSPDSSIYNIHLNDHKIGTISQGGLYDQKTFETKPLPYISLVQLHKDFTKHGLGKHIYDAFEKEIGRKLLPSPLGLSESAEKLWKRRLKQMPYNEAKALIDEAKEIGAAHGVANSATKRLDPLIATHPGRPVTANSISTTASYSDVANQQWVHYSDEPVLSINYNPSKQSHQDIAGIYFFPESFKPVGYWKQKKYKFVVQIKPNAKILDLATISLDHLNEILNKAGCLPSYQEYTKQYPPKNHKKAVDMAWETMRRYYAFEVKFRAYGEWNKLIRSFGYDAIFDDTNSVHTKEDQLIILNPRIISNKQLYDNKSKTFANATKIFNEFIELLKPFKPYDIKPPKKERERYSNHTSIQANVSIGDKESWTNYTTFQILTDDKGDVQVYIKYGGPRDGYKPYLIYSSSNDSYDPPDWKEKFIKYCEAVTEKTATAKAIHQNSVEIDSAAKDTIKCLFVNGPTFDGEIPSKSARDNLVDDGYVEHRFGFAWLNKRGIKLALKLGLEKVKNTRDRARSNDSDLAAKLRRLNPQLADRLQKTESATIKPDHPYKNPSKQIVLDIIEAANNKYPYPPGNFDSQQDALEAVRFILQNNDCWVWLSLGKTHLGMAKILGIDLKQNDTITGYFAKDGIYPGSYGKADIREILKNNKYINYLYKNIIIKDFADYRRFKQDKLTTLAALIKHDILYKNPSKQLVTNIINQANKENPYNPTDKNLLQDQALEAVRFVAYENDVWVCLALDMIHKNMVSEIGLDYKDAKLATGHLAKDAIYITYKREVDIVKNNAALKKLYPTTPIKQYEEYNRLKQDKLTTLAASDVINTRMAEIFVNPSANDIHTILKESKHKGVRFLLVHEDASKLYAWDAEKATHFNIIGYFQRYQKYTPDWIKADMAVTDEKEIKYQIREGNLNKLYVINNNVYTFAVDHDLKTYQELPTIIKKILPKPKPYILEASMTDSIDKLWDVFAVKKPTKPVSKKPPAKKLTPKPPTKPAPIKKTNTKPPATSKPKPKPNSKTEPKVTKLSGSHLLEHHMDRYREHAENARKNWADYKLHSKHAQVYTDYARNTKNNDAAQAIDKAKSANDKAILNKSEAQRHYQLRDYHMGEVQKLHAQGVKPLGLMPAPKGETDKDVKKLAPPPSLFANKKK